MFCAEVVQVGAGAHEKAGEFLGEDVVRAYGVPGLAGHFLLVGSGFGDVAEVGVGYQFDLVVVVENDAFYAGDAEVFQQQVAGEDIGGGELLDGPAVVAQGLLGVGLVGLVEVDVKGCHFLLDVDVADKNAVFGDLDLGRRGVAEFLQAGGVETVQRQGEFLEQVAVGHAAYAVVALYEVVLFLDHPGRDLLGRREAVADDLEDHVQGRHSENVHHHAGDAGGGNEPFGLTLLPDGGLCIPRPRPLFR